MKKLELHKEYGYNTIKVQLSEIKYEEIEHGSYYIGENFLVFKNLNTGDVCSFVLSGATSSQGIFKLIYKDND